MAYYRKFSLRYMTYTSSVGEGIACADREIYIRLFDKSDSVSRCGQLIRS